MTPTRSRPLTTGRWRMRFPVIMAAHSSTDVSGAQAVTGVVMTSATLVAAGSRRGATTRRRISRSVKMPTSRPPSVTTSPPIPRSLMSSAALSTVSPGFTEMTSLPFLVRISWTVGTLPPPAGGFLDTTALTARAPPYPVPAMHIEEGASSGGAAMAQPRINVGPLDARARQVAGVLAIVGGLTALDGFFQALGFLTWIVCATMMYVGILFAMGGFKAGTAAFGYPLLILSVLDPCLPTFPKGYGALSAGVALAMGEVSIALPDTLHDPLVNPAKGARLRVARLFSSPTIYGVSHDAGSGRTLPMGVFTPGAAWYGGLALAVQQVDASQPSSSFFNPPSPLAGGLGSTTPDLGPGPLSHGNTLGFAMIGRNLRESGLSVGASVRWAKLRAVDGVDLLYPGSRRVDQSGATVAARLGVLKEWAGDRSFEAVVLHDRFKMTHDVTFVDAFWDPGTQQFFQRSRLEHNRDFTKQWGLQVKYERPLTASGWRIGWLATANRTSQPNTPSSDLLNIPQIGRATCRERA